MTATCAFCAASIPPADDPVFDGDDPRRARALQSILSGFGKHLERFHRDKAKDTAQLLLFAGATAQNLTVMSFLGDDPELKAAVDQMRFSLDRALDAKGDLSQKLPKPGPLLVQP